MSKEIHHPRPHHSSHGHEVNPYIAIGASLAGIYLVIVMFFLIFASEQASILVSIAGWIVVLGIAMALFSYLSNKKR